MAFRYVEFEEAKAASGLRMIVVGGVPSPWGEAAKGLLHVKGIDWLATRLRYDDKTMREWSATLSAPVAVLNEDAPVAISRDIALLAERIAPSPPLLPDEHRDDILAFIDEIAGEGGLGWDRRVHLVEASLNGEAGFPEQVAQYLAAKYGHSAEVAARAGAKVIDRLGALAARLRAQEAAGSGYYFGAGLTAADVYSAAFMALFDPLPEDQCAMNPATRGAFSLLDEPTRAALDPVLLAHRDRIYRDHLALPLAL